MSHFIRTIVPEDGLRNVKNTSGGTLRKGTFVKLYASASVEDEVAPCSAATDFIYGVVYGHDIADGAYGTVQIRGKAAVFGGDVVAIGAQVTSDANGDGVATTTAEDQVAGVAVTAGADGAYFEVELNITGAHVPTA
jgi:hypothetical protein